MQDTIKQQTVKLSKIYNLANDTGQCNTNNTFSQFERFGRMKESYFDKKNPFLANYTHFTSCSP